MDHVLFPRFWIEEPALWFAQVEAVFALNNITSDTDKYNYILCELPSTVISLLKNLILDSTNYLEGGKYDKIKKELIRSISIVELKKEEIGTKKPSEFYTHLKQKADKFIPDEILKELWLEKMPLQVNKIVSDMKGDIESICKVADTVKDYFPVLCQNWDLRKIGTRSLEDVPKLLENLGIQLNNIQTELLKFKLVYSTNITNLESVQAELHKFKMTCDYNNTRLETIYRELKNIKTIYYSKNNNEAFLCKICQEDKRMNNSEEDKSDHSTGDETSKLDSNSGEGEVNNESEYDTLINEDKEKPTDKSKASVDAFCWYHCIYGINAHNCLAPCNFKERQAQQAAAISKST